MARSINRARPVPKRATAPRRPAPQKADEAISAFIRVLERLDAAPAAPLPTRLGAKQNKALDRAPEGR
ncbi:hypothetical protein ACFFJ7_12630 [Pseudochelatococcus lubricantis]|uniref:hypothetical protein n=1 Tax=Pseudochelatococcus lubricantis TaxID=1538102 RepID=UPI0035E86D79